MKIQKSLAKSILRSIGAVETRDFDEAKHPRASDGEFGAGGSAQPSGKPKKAKKAKPTSMAKAARDQSKAKADKDKKDRNRAREKAGKKAMRAKNHAARAESAKKLGEALDKVLETVKE